MPVGALVRHRSRERQRLAEAVRIGRAQPIPREVAELKVARAAAVDPLKLRHVSRCFPAIRAVPFERPVGRVAERFVTSGTNERIDRQALVKQVYARIELHALYDWSAKVDFRSAIAPVAGIHEGVHTDPINSRVTAAPQPLSFAVIDDHSSIDLLAVVMQVDLVGIC